MHKLRVLICLLALILPACSVTSQASPALSSEERQHTASLINPQIIQAENSLGLQLHRQLVESGTGENVMISPYSISTALALAYNGSAGETASEMTKTLGWDDITLEDLNEHNEQLRKLLSDSDDGIELNIANSVWVKEGTEFKQPFLRASKDSYNADIYSLKLSNTKTMDKINNWVKQHTNNKITQILANPLSPLTESVLINAIYFNGTWEHSFSEDNTQEESFVLTDGSTQQVQMMRQTYSFPYAETEDWQSIRLPYGDGRMSMLIILPSEQSSLGELQQELWKDPSPWQQTFDENTVNIGLPRFQIEYKQQLKTVLQNIGMKLAFQPEVADFSRMSNERQLYISSIMHETLLEVNEKGAEAAAVTSILVDAGSSSAPPEPVNMTLNRPFFFAIEDTQSKAWLFLGSVTQP
ncbi:serpin B [Paenibacillus sp. DS2015]|uniref:serpin family protein n=1 Tax=Paenibacillus sp. DS2015 TaxID=3373917 RepID=UPI003D1CB662